MCTTFQETSWNLRDGHWSSLIFIFIFYTLYLLLLLLWIVHPQDYFIPQLSVFSEFIVLALVFASHLCLMRTNVNVIIGAHTRNTWPEATKWTYQQNVPVPATALWCVCLCCTNALCTIREHCVAYHPSVRSLFCSTLREAGSWQS